MGKRVHAGEETLQPEQALPMTHRPGTPWGEAAAAGQPPAQLGQLERTQDLGGGEARGRREVKRQSPGEAAAWSQD